MAEVPSWERPRRNGESNLNAVRDGLRISKVLLRERLAGRGSPVRMPVMRPVEAGHDTADHVVIDLDEKQHAGDHVVIDLTSRDEPAPARELPEPLEEQRVEMA